MRLISVMLALTLSGCLAELADRLPQPGARVLEEPTETHGGIEVITEPNGAEIVEQLPPLPPECFARAAHFKGLVALPCEAVAREVRP